MLLTGDLAKSKFYVALANWKTTRTMANITSFFEVISSKKVETSERWDHEKSQYSTAFFGLTWKLSFCLKVYLQKWHSGLSWQTSSKFKRCWVSCYQKIHPGPTCRMQKKSIEKSNESVDSSPKPSCSKTKRLSILDVPEFLISNNIQRVVELMAVAQ